MHKFTMPKEAQALLTLILFKGGGDKFIIIRSPHLFVHLITFLIPTSDFFSITAMCLLFPTNYALIAYLVNDLSSNSSTSMHMAATLNCLFPP